MSQKELAIEALDGIRRNNPNPILGDRYQDRLRLESKAREDAQRGVFDPPAVAWNGTYYDHDFLHTAADFIVYRKAHATRLERLKRLQKNTT